MGKYKRLLSNTAILGAGTFTSKVLVFLLMPLYTALLSTEEFGIADILTQTANLIIPLAVLGIGDALFRFAIDRSGEEKQAVFSTAIFVFLAALLPLALIIQVLRFFDIYDGYIWLVMLYICSANLHSICSLYVRACDKTKIFALQGIINTVLTILLNILFLVVFDMGVTGYVLSVAIANILVTVLLVFWCRLYKDIKFKRPNGKLLSDMLKFSIPYIPTTMMWMITSASDRFIVTAYCGVAENGLYAAAYKLPTLIILAGGVFIEAWQFSSVNDVTEEERSKFFSTVYKNYMSIIFMGTSMLILLSKVLTAMLLNSSYYISWKYVPVLGIAMIFSAFSSFMGSVYFIEKKSVMALITASVGALSNVAMNFVLIPYYGAMGAAIATAISYAIVFVIRALNTRRYLKFKLHIHKVIINTLVIVAQAGIMILELPFWIFWQVGMVLFLVVFNAKDIFIAIKGFLSKFLKNKKKNI